MNGSPCRHPLFGPYLLGKCFFLVLKIKVEEMMRDEDAQFGVRLCDHFSWFATTLLVPLTEDTTARLVPF